MLVVDWSNNSFLDFFRLLFRCILDKDFKNVDCFLAKAEERKEILGFCQLNLLLTTERGSGVTHFVYRVRLVIVNNTDLARIGKLDHLTVFNIQDVLNRQRDLDAISVVVRSENNSLEALDPFLGARSTVCPEVVRSVMCDDGKVKAILVFI